MSNLTKQFVKMIRNDPERVREKLRERRVKGEQVGLLEDLFQAEMMMIQCEVLICNCHLKDGDQFLLF